MLLEDRYRIENDLGPLLEHTPVFELTGGFAGARFIPGERRITCPQHALHDRRIGDSRCAVVRPVTMCEHDDRMRPAAFRQPQIADCFERHGLKNDCF